MGRAPCCDKASVKRGPWSPEEDATLKSYLEEHGTGGNWIALPHKAGLRRCGKSCRLRWLNYLRPGIKHGGFTQEEDNIIFTLYSSIGSRWSVIASQLPGRTDNDVKNYWNTKLKKKILAAKIGGKSCNRDTTIHLNPAAQFPATVPKLEANYSNGNSSSQLPYLMDMSHQQYVDPQPQGTTFNPSQFPLSTLIAASDFGTTTSNSYSISPSQDVSSLSNSSSAALENNHASWPGNNASIDIEDNLLLDFCFESPFELLNAFSFQEKCTSPVAVAPHLGNTYFTG